MCRGLQWKQDKRDAVAAGGGLGGEGGHKVAISLASSMVVKKELVRRVSLTGCRLQSSLRVALCLLSDVCGAWKPAQLNGRHTTALPNTATRA